MNISPVMLTKTSFGSNYPIKELNKKPARETINDDNSKQSKHWDDYCNYINAVMAHPEIPSSNKPRIETFVAQIEKPLESGVADKILEHQKFIKKLMEEYPDEEKGLAIDSKGTKYRWLHNFSTVRIEQGGKDISFELIQRQKDGKVQYSFSDCENNHKYGFCEALMEDDNLVHLTTGYEFYRPVTITYEYKEGKPASAEMKVYDDLHLNSDFYTKSSRFLLDEEGKVKRVYYDIKKDTINNAETIGQIYKRNEDGSFEEV